MKLITIRVAVIATLMCISLAPLSACGVLKHTIGEHSFRIPEANLVDANVSFLPASQNDAIRFVIDPTVPLPKQNMVTLRTQMPCSPSSPWCRVRPISAEKLVNTKLRRVGPEDRLTWTYTSIEGEPVVSCSAAGDHEGLCTYYGTYEDLYYSLDLRDSQMPQLLALVQTTDGLLKRWEA